MANLKETYKTQVAPALKEKLGLKLLKTAGVYAERVKQGE